ncbi:MAG: ribosome biogenesis GTP-binding protein YihA/YsxC [Gammaproteobacteria bacterium]|jgi:GTP-binding protein|nr:YihA family ribosome biogenesis GTP-binding protein [Chromatiales bacterium]MDP6673254.1 ribosome biogenesis GTP-binding protein YihA/YsxC [Gammaproteobacteria bacterium]
MSEFPDAHFLTSANDPAQFVIDEGAEVAFAGRSNAGKSTAINAIVRRRNFARTSKQPGRTQLVNFFSLGDQLRLVDLPGYGYAKVSRSMRRHWQELLEGYFQSRRSLSGTILVVDSRRLLGEFDRLMIDWCQAIDCPVHVLLTKADKLNRREAAAGLAEVRSELGDFATAQLFSGTKGQGLTEARQSLQALLIGARRGSGSV